MDDPVYQLYLQNATAYAIGYWLLALLAVVFPLLLWQLSMKRGRFSPIDGLPENATAVAILVGNAAAIVTGAILLIISLASAIPPTFTPELWALSMTVCK